MRTGITVDVSAGDRARLEAIVADRNSPQKHVWRARIVLLSADAVGGNEIMRQTGKSKTCLWRWQERFMHEGVDGLLRDKTRPSRIPPLLPAIGERVVALTQADPPGETRHWTAAAVAALVRISVSSVQRIWRSHGLQPHRVRRSSCRATRSSSPSCATSSVSTSTRRHTRWFSASTRSRMCGWPPARKGRDCAEAGGLLAVMCPASLCGSHDRRPRWVFAGWNLIKSSGLTPLTSPGFSSSVGAPDRSITVSLLQVSAD
jgi:transposase